MLTRQRVTCARRPLLPGRGTLYVWDVDARSGAAAWRTAGCAQTGAVWSVVYGGAGPGGPGGPPPIFIDVVFDSVFCAARRMNPDFRTAVSVWGPETAGCDVPRLRLCPQRLDEAAAGGVGDAAAKGAARGSGVCGIIEGAGLGG